MEQKKSKVIIISIVVAFVLVVGTIATVSLVSKSSNEPTKVASQKLSLGQKFLLDLDYEKAVAEFNAVIEIEPRNVDAYIGLADAYIGMGDEEKAIEALEKGYEATGDETIKKKLDELKRVEETTVSETTTPENERIQNYYNDDGSYEIVEYLDDGGRIKYYYNDTYYKNEFSIFFSEEFDNQNRLVKLAFYEQMEKDEIGNITDYEIFVYDGDSEAPYEQYGYSGSYYIIGDGINYYCENELYSSGYLKQQKIYVMNYLDEKVLVSTLNYEDGYCHLAGDVIISYSRYDSGYYVHHEPESAEPHFYR